jgi:NADH dehydrogenase [ubiquinone] 1 alpha subcomplex assembly factor 1
LTIVTSLEAIKGATAPYILHSFEDSESVSDCKTMADKDIGGFSECTLQWVPYQIAAREATGNQESKGYGRFSGNISIELPKNKPEIQRTGYAAWRTNDRQPTIFGKSLWDIDPYSYLALRIKSDGRSYFVNVQTESVVPTDLHQHRLFSKRPGEWETILINWNDFVRTNHGFVVEPQTEIMRQKVSSIGIGLTDRVPGLFELCIEKIWATNDSAEGQTLGSAAGGEGELRNRQGQKVKWGEFTAKKSS